MTDPAPPPRRDAILLRTAQLFFSLYALIYLMDVHRVRPFSPDGYNTLFWIALWTLIGGLLLHVLRGESEGRGGWILFLFLVGMFASAGLMVRLMVLHNLR